MEPMEALQVRSRPVLDGLAEAVVCVDHEGRLLDCNERALGLLGIGHPRERPIWFWDFDMALDASEWPAFRQRAAAGWAEPRRLRTAQGGSATRVAECHPGDVADLWFLRSEQVADDRSLRSVRGVLFRDLPYPQLIVDPRSGRLIDANLRACAFYGYGRDRLLTLNIQDINTLSQARIAAEMRRARTLRRTYFEFEHRLADGSLRSVQVCSVPFLHDGRRLLHSVIHDVTELTRLNARLASYRDFVDRLPVGVFRTVSKGEGRIVMANPALCDIFEAASEDELTSRTPGSLYAHPGGRRRFLDSIERDREISSAIHEMVTLKGRRIWVEMTARRIERDDGAVSYEGAMVDITEMRQAHDRALLADRIIETAREGVTITDPDGRITHVNPSFTRITGYDEDEVLGADPGILKSGRQSRAFYERMWSELRARGHWQGELWNRRKNGEIYPEWMSISAIRDSAGRLQNYAAVFTDLTEIRRSQEELERLQRFDLLTGLLNRDAFLQTGADDLAGLADAGAACTLFALSLENLSHVDNIAGPEATDTVLMTLSDRLARFRSEQVVRVARISRKRFALILRGPGDTVAIDQWATELMDAVRRPMTLDDGQRVKLAPVVGVSAFPADARSPGRLLAHAESALDRARQEGLGAYRVFRPEIEARAHRRLWLEQALADALDAGDLSVAFQPICRVGDGAIVGAEALARWHHPEEGWIAPDEFIARAEDSGQIDRLTFQLMDPALAAFARLRAVSGRDLVLTFNFSTVQLLENDLAERLLARLDEAGIPPGDFNIEVTETRLMTDVADSLACIRSLQSAGINISIDDFGTGFSSLAYLQEIQPQRLKIDRRFIQRLPKRRTDAQLTSTIIAMANALDMEVVAEAVETREQLAFLKGERCGLFQGYLCSPPVGVDEFESLI